MALKYLLDSNVIIDLFGNKLPDDRATFIKKLPILISVVSRIELIGRYEPTVKYLQKINSFLHDATIYELDETIILQAIDIRQKNKIKLPDAIIAATARTNKMTLITHNIDDFKTIRGLKIIDSWKS